MKKYVDEKKKVILMLGITGVGKSSFANTLFWRQDEFEVGSNIESCTV